MRGNTKSSPAVETAKVLNLRSEGPAEITLSTGDKAILKPVTASLIDAVTSRIEDPKPPMWHNESKGIDEPNPSHPDYLAAVDDANRRRGIAAMDAMVMFGEIGSSQEERVADLIGSGRVTKPLVAYIGGRGAQSGTRFSHAGAIIEGDRGTYEGKVKRLREVGATVVDNFGDIADGVKSVIRPMETGKISIN